VLIKKIFRNTEQYEVDRVAPMHSLLSHLFDTGIVIRIEEQAGYMLKFESHQTYPYTRMMFNM